METSRTPQNVAWPDKLITQAEAFAKAASWPTGATVDFSGDIGLACRSSAGPGTEAPAADRTMCGQQICQLVRGGVTYNGTLDEILSAVLRHMVMAHDVPLNTRPRTDSGPCTGPGCDHVSHGPPPLEVNALEQYRPGLTDQED